MLAPPSKATSCFVYGTLMSPDVLKVLLGRVPAMVPRATLRDHSRHPVRERVYPGVIPSPPRAGGDGAMSSVEGILLLEVSSLELRRLYWFEDEGADYVRSKVQATVPRFDEGITNDMIVTDKDDSGNQMVRTNAYIWALGASTLDTSRDWDYDAFVANRLDWYMERVVKPCKIEVDRTIS
ncbi:hypothetical protein ACHAWF_011197 [Thalassiosira exigua]